MTIVVNAFFGTGSRDCPWVMVHASDRLVSLRRPGRFEPKYPVFNKTILYQSTDAIVTIGFQGLAFIEGKPTDQWIASQLLGVDLQEPLGVSFGQQYDRLNLGQAAMRLEHALNQTLTDSRVVAPPALLIAGARRKKSRWCRVALSIQREQSQFRCHYFRWETRDQWRSRLLVGPRGWLPTETAQKYADDLCASRSVADIQRVVDRLVTEVGDANPTAIGRDITGVTLLPFSTPKLDVVYLHRSGEPTFEGFTPWVIGPRAVLAPVAVSTAIGLPLNRAHAVWRPIGLSDTPTGREAPVTDGLVFSFRAHPNREQL